MRLNIPINSAHSKDNQLKYKEVNKHPKFIENFNIQHQLEHFEYVMIHALVSNYFVHT